MRKRYVYVILNYNTYQDTINCIYSIYKYTDLNKIDLKIIIVDNASTNDSVLKLESKYKNDNIIKIIKSKENLGFSKGNNIGFKYAKDNYNPDFIILNNSDTELLDENFYINIDEAYNDYKFAVLGPKELLKDGSFFPLQKNIPDIKEVKFMIGQVKRRLFAYRFFLSSFYNFFTKMKSKLKNKKYIIRDELDVSKCHLNIVLHGEFLVFSKIYIDKYDGLNSKTFMYQEENLLSLRLKENKMISLYYPKITIFHKRHGSVNSSKNSKRTKEIVRCKRQLESLKILYNAILNDDY